MNATEGAAAWRDGDDWSPNPDAHTLSLPEQIAKRIGSAIIAGEIEAGARLHEVELAARFEVSRAPVREALRILERDGLVDLLARRGASVTQLTASELDHIFDPRIVLNGLLARRVAERADADFALRFTEEVKDLARLANAGDTNGYVAGVYRVHRLLGTGCDNPFLKRLVFVLTHQTARYTRLGLSTPERQKQSVRNWKRVARAVAAHDGAAAAAAAEQLARDSRDMAMRLLIEAPAPNARAQARKVASAH
jgi:DNA-binding GntR family transcriptional regulator